MESETQITFTEAEVELAAIGIYYQNVSSEAGGCDCEIDCCT